MYVPWPARALCTVTRVCPVYCDLLRVSCTVASYLFGRDRNLVKFPGFVATGCLSRSALCLTAPCPHCLNTPSPSLPHSSHYPLATLSSFPICFIVPFPSASIAPLPSASSSPHCPLFSSASLSPLPHCVTDFPLCHPVTDFVTDFLARESVPLRNILSPTFPSPPFTILSLAPSISLSSPTFPFAVQRLSLTPSFRCS